MKKLRLYIIILSVSFFFTNCSKEEAEVKEQCEISGTGTIIVANKTSYAITVKIDGATPSGFGYISPGEQAEAEYTSGTHTLHAQTAAGSSANHVWDNTISVGTCKRDQHNIIL